jgi:hypothetical protein
MSRQNVAEEADLLSKFLTDKTLLRMGELDPLGHQIKYSPVSMIPSIGQRTNACRLIIVSEVEHS